MLNSSSHHCIADRGRSSYRVFASLFHLKHFVVPFKAGGPRIFW